MSGSGHTQGLCRMVAFPFAPENTVVDASGHLNPTGLGFLKQRVLSEINVHDYDVVVSGSVLVAYAIDVRRPAG